MRLSTKSKYGVRFMLELALKGRNKAITLKEVSTRQAISEKYLWQVVSPLRIAGLITSARGARGGYSLAELPEKITIKDIVLALEGDTLLVKCVQSPESCARHRNCAARDVWAKIDRQLLGSMEGITLAEMVKIQESKETTRNLNYEI